jgi:hypothetical protein
LSICRLRAAGIITPETETFLVQLGHVEQTVSVHLRKFPSGGSWSWFGCPTCGKWVRTLRLLGDEIVCRDCCERRRVRHRACTMSPKQRALHRIPKLRAKLESAESLRLKPHLWGKLERRSRLEMALARNEFILSQGRRYRDVLKQTQAMEIEPEPIARPKIKSPRKR